MGPSGAGTHGGRRIILNPLSVAYSEFVHVRVENERNEARSSEECTSRPITIRAAGPYVHVASSPSGRVVSLSVARFLFVRSSSFVALK